MILFVLFNWCRTWEVLRNEDYLRCYLAADFTFYRACPFGCADECRKRDIR